MCENNECGVHNRIDSEDISRAEDFITKVTYRGDWAILTGDNVFMVYMALIGKEPFPFLSLLIKVGDHTIGDMIDNPELMMSAVYDGFFSRDIDSAIDVHEMMGVGLDSGLLVPDKAITPLELVNRY